jgi:type IV pilus assembly protein PilE
MKAQQGMTLIELMVVVAIVAILASIAVPTYRDYVTRGRLAEPTSMIAAQRVRMEQFYQDMRTYSGACQAGTVAPKPADTNLWRYTCNIAGDGQSYVVQADGLAGMAGWQFTVDQNNTRATPAAPSGWGAPKTCWIRAKGGQC